MLKRIVTFENIGRFATLKQKAPQLKELSLIFARNGYGKSTLCAALRSLAESETNHIAARRRLGSANLPLVHFDWDPYGAVTFSSGTWNAQVGNVHIFDQEFVHHNIHVGESVTRGNKRSLLPIVLGERGGQLSERIRLLDQQQRDLDKDIKDLTKLISAACPAIPESKLREFCEREIPSDIEEQIANAEKSLELAKEAKTVQQKAHPKPLPVADLAFYKQLLGRGVEGVSQSVADRVAAHIEKHQLSPPKGDRWIAYGLEHIADSKCPFCAQDITGNSLVESYQSYYSEEFAKLVEEIDSAKSKVDELLEGDTLRLLIEANDTDYEFWTKVVDVKKRSELTVDETDAIRQALKALQSLLAKKSASPLNQIPFGEQGEQIATALMLVVTYNDHIATAQVAIETAKQDAQKSNFERAQQRFDQWQAIAKKAADPLKTHVDKYLMAQKSAKQVEKDKKAKKKELTDHADSTMKVWQTKINELLSDFGADFSISNTKANFKGREANTDYSITLNGNHIVAGEKLDDQPSFKTVLSAGDKSTLALAFFIARLETEDSLSQCIIVFDDPFSSQDMHRQFETSSRIRSLVGRAAQVMVFSHDPRFLAMIEKDADNGLTNTYQLQCTDGGQGTLEKWSSEIELKQEYVRQAEMIREYAHQGNLLPGTSISTVVQAIRPFLEGYLRARCPGKFSDDKTLYEMTKIIETAGQAHPLYNAIKPLRALNEYTRRYMHGGDDASVAKELRAQTNKVVRLLGW